MDHLIDDEAPPHRERELTLSTGAILGIFLGLAILCGAFFGFGYNMGRKSVPTPLALNDLGDNRSASSDASAAKPAAGTAAEDDTTAVVAPPAKPPIRPRHALPAPAAADAEAVTARGEGVSPTTRSPLKESESAPVATAAKPPAVPATAGAGSFVVQIAAVSHKEDADLLLGALRGRGYAVAARSSPADGFIHIQVGPFASKKDADAMRQRLIADGYNAIIK